MNILKLRDAVVIVNAGVLAITGVIAIFIGIPVYLGNKFGVDATLIYMLMIFVTLAIAIVYSQIDDSNYTIVAKKVKENGKKLKNK